MDTPALQTHAWDEPKDFRLPLGIEHVPTPSRYEQLRSEVGKLGADAAASVGSPRERSHWLGELAERYERLAEFDCAIAATSEALELLADETGMEDASDYIHLLHARLHCRSGRLDESRETLQSRLNRADADRDGQSASTILTCLATVDLARSDRSSALDCLNRAFGLARTTGFTSGKGQALSGAGALYVLAGDYDYARRLLHRAALLHQRCGDVNSLGKTYNNIGTAFFGDEGNYVDAIPFLELGLDFTCVDADLIATLNTLSNNATAFLHQYQEEPSDPFRGRIEALVTSLPDPGIDRLADRTVIPRSDVRRQAAFRDRPVVTDSVLLAPFPTVGLS
jgi:hypothetical protein